MALRINKINLVSHAFLFFLLTAPIYFAPSFLPVAHPLIWVAVLTALSWFFLKRGGRTLTALGLNPAWCRLGQLGAGILFGALLILLAAICISIFLPFKWAWNPNFEWNAALFALLYFLSGNAVEELIFRGYSFERLIVAIGLWKAQLVTAILFALFHILSGWPWQMALTGTIAGSLLFGIVFARWRSLPAAIGLHAATNWTRDLLLSDPPTPHTLYAPLSTRPWTPTEQITATLFMDGLFLLAALAIWLTQPTTKLARTVPSPNQPARAVSG